MVRLGAYLADETPAWKQARKDAFARNPWFIEPFINEAIFRICNDYLRPETLEPWANSYDWADGHPQPHMVGIVMAGNIPLVGFHDFLCGFVSGVRMMLKLSARDEVLLTHIVSVLKQWEPAAEELITLSSRLKGCDAYIATGSDTSAGLFAYYFSRYPHIIRHNRSSVAILDGMETGTELGGLADDLLLYFGMGCRNVSQVFVPNGYDFGTLLDATERYGFLSDHHRYRNNLDYRLAVLLLNGVPYLSRPHLLLVEDASLFSPIGVLHYQHYRDREKLVSDLKRSPNLQCIVGSREITYGKSQQPGLSDWADGINTMEFLGTLNNFP
jgi:hypothetical protein